MWSREDLAKAGIIGDSVFRDLEASAERIRKRITNSESSSVTSAGLAEKEFLSEATELLQKIDHLVKQYGDFSEQNHRERVAKWDAYSLGMEQLRRQADYLRHRFRKLLREEASS